MLTYKWLFEVRVIDSHEHFGCRKGSGMDIGHFLLLLVGILLSNVHA